MVLHETNIYSSYGCPVKGIGGAKASRPVSADATDVLNGTFISMRSPAFQFYPADWLSDEQCSLYSLEEEGAYIRLICYCWREGTIPADPEKCAKLIGKGCSTNLARVVQGGFLQDPSNKDRMIHPRLEQERAKQMAWKSKCSIGGKHSQQQQKVTKTRVVQVDTNKGSSTLLLQSSSSSSDIDIVSQASEIYALYPRKVGRPKAIQSIVKSIKAFGFEDIKAKTALYAKTINGKEQQFIPHPTTWFNQQRFNDDPATWNSDSFGGNGHADAIQPELSDAELIRQSQQ